MIKPIIPPISTTGGDSASIQRPGDSATTGSMDKTLKINNDAFLSMAARTKGTEKAEPTMNKKPPDQTSNPTMPTEFKVDPKTRDNNLYSNERSFGQGTSSGSESGGGGHSGADGNPKQPENRESKKSSWFEGISIVDVLRNLPESYKKSREQRRQDFIDAYESKEQPDSHEEAVKRADQGMEDWKNVGLNAGMSAGGRLVEGAIGKAEQIAARKAEERAARKAESSPLSHRGIVKSVSTRNVEIAENLFLCTSRCAYGFPAAAHPAHVHTHSTD